MKEIAVRLSEQVSRFETTRERLKDIAEHLGVSEQNAVAYAINKAWEYLDEHEDMLYELESKRRGRKVGGITYLNYPEDFLRRVEERIAKGVALPHEDDDALESNLLFQFLSRDQQAAIRAASDPAEKRRLKEMFLKETSPERAADNLQGVNR
jgi:molybdenum-dependent DNA-binding transcriptional regulator ModE